MSDDATLREAIIEVRIRMPYRLLASCDKKAAEFALNESSSCADNIIEHLIELYEAKTDDDCFCDTVHATFIGWRTGDMTP